MKKKEGLSNIVYNGMTIKPVYMCPFGCEKDSQYPTYGWKTEAGFRKHLAKCFRNPDKAAARKRGYQERVYGLKKTDN